MLDKITHGIEAFIGLFKAGGETFVGLVTGILPTLIVLMVAINSIIKIIGESRVDRFAQKISKYSFARYLVLPFLGVFCLANPMCYTFGRFLKEEHKPGYYDAAVSFVHPITGLFPHANPGELFVWLGISAGLTTLGQSTTKLALVYFLTGLVVIFIRGMVTEKIYKYLAGKSKK
ncbi:PTS glucitol/sorbitol transporter subunit IIC [Gemella sp. zg-1178]|uniref:PTS glucitol/sorbitol transporter subunit IIC n=1 Tax=Gemella sp. zg-1178 TaxID=2840372 RepID=UPI001C05CBBD|nr:PTS glucitol/sorbitol transporter subunit IIC [Gemella sp. zg-1178]MBU0278442.1 PTS glucitol/sorbitol transporter subunit IIC [Gemella sp. zg-1178]